MKEAFGGIFTMQALVVFLVLASGLLAFSVSYTKSFRIKNEIRRVVEQYEGLTSDAKLKIKEVAEKYNYNVSDPSLYASICTKNGYTAQQVTLSDGNNAVYCVKCELVSTEKTKYKGSYYTIVTFINIDIPIINRIFPKAAAFLQTKGETSLIYSSGTDTELCRNLSGNS